MNPQRTRALTWILSALGTVVFLGVALLEWQRGGTYRAVLAVVMAGLLALNGRREPVGVWSLLFLAALVTYGMVRVWTVLHAVMPPS